ncbi:MAG: hypothetical protein JJE39_12500 [Vicinamibacteria bacterium]|nr:hypothetical protein [Vicinamibacteria bacterium]
MTLLTLSLAALSLGASAQAVCSLPPDVLSTPHVFTNADLERMAACRYQTGAESRPGSRSRTSGPPPTRRSTGPMAKDGAGADWRAQWRAIDQKARRLRLEAKELRQEASEAPRDPKKRPTGRRSPSLLEARARSLEAEAKELEDEFQERARREGALPGWLRAKGR